jgi:hypothetical protein
VPKFWQNFTHINVKNMKLKLAMSFVIVTFLVACSANEFEIKESEVPPSVLAALKAKYPSAQVIKWEAEKEGGKFYFEAEIKDGGKEREIHISPDGSSVTEDD